MNSLILRDSTVLRIYSSYSRCGAISFLYEKRKLCKLAEDDHSTHAHLNFKEIVTICWIRKANIRLPGGNENE